MTYLQGAGRPAAHKAAGHDPPVPMRWLRPRVAPGPHWRLSHGPGCRAAGCGGRWKGSWSDTSPSPRVAERLGVAWDTADHADFAAGKPVLIDAPAGLLKPLPWPAGVDGVLAVRPVRAHHFAGTVRPGEKCDRMSRKRPPVRCGGGRAATSARISGWVRSRLSEVGRAKTRPAHLVQRTVAAHPARAVTPPPLSAGCAWLPRRPRTGRTSRPSGPLGGRGPPPAGG